MPLVTLFLSGTGRFPSGSRSGLEWAGSIKR